MDGVGVKYLTSIIDKINGKFESRAAAYVILVDESIMLSSEPKFAMNTATKIITEKSPNAMSAQVSATALVASI